MGNYRFNNSVNLNNLLLAGWIDNVSSVLFVCVCIANDIYAESHCDSAFFIK